MAFLAPAAVGATTAGTTAAAAGAAAQGAAITSAAAATTAATTAASTSTLLGSLSSIYSTLQPVLTAVSIASPFIAMASTGAMMAQQMALANQQASLTEYEVESMKQASMLRAADRKRKMRRAVGTQLALYGSAGVDPLRGTPVDVMADTAKTFAFDQYTDDFNVSSRAYAGMIKAKNQRDYGKQQAVGSLLDFGTRFAMRG